MKKMWNHKVKGLALLVLMMALAMTGVLADTDKNPEKVISGKVVKVADGDTFTMLVKGKQVRVRLHGIDAPEMTGSQPYCRQSKEKLSSLLAGKTVTVRVNGYDRYERALGIVSTDACKDVNLEMLRSGMAWHYKHFDHTPAYIKAAETARKNRVGLWRDKQPINPYKWRRDH